MQTILLRECMLIKGVTDMKNYIYYTLFHLLYFLIFPIRFSYKTFNDVVSHLFNI